MKADCAMRDSICSVYPFVLRAFYFRHTPDMTDFEVRWAQKWAQSFGVYPSVGTFCNWHNRCYLPATWPNSLLALSRVHTFQGTCFLPQGAESPHFSSRSQFFACIAGPCGTRRLHVQPSPPDGRTERALGSIAKRESVCRK
jgi:hypothetical protein